MIPGETDGWNKSVLGVGYVDVTKVVVCAENSDLYIERLTLKILRYVSSRYLAIRADSPAGVALIAFPSEDTMSE